MTLHLGGNKLNKAEDLCFCFAGSDCERTDNSMGVDDGETLNSLIRAKLYTAAYYKLSSVCPVLSGGTFVHSICRSLGNSQQRTDLPQDYTSLCTAGLEMFGSTSAFTCVCRYVAAFYKYRVRAGEGREITRNSWICANSYKAVQL